jgi:Plasmid pRiA4b ORF-3-like protein
MPFQLKITLQNIEPPIWRRVLVPRELTLFELHHVIQIAMGWGDSHLHDFTIKRQRYVFPHPDDFDDSIDEREILLCDVVRSRSKFVYQYDFGDGWDHDILVEKVVRDADAPGPTCVDGARACPPEDSGGPWGYQQKLEAIANPDDEESEELREWMDPDFDAELFNVDSVNKELRRFFRPTRSRTTRAPLQK